MMKKLPRYTLRVPKSMLNKLAYTSDFYGRTKNKEIEYIIRKYLNEFERMYGPIPDNDDDE